MDPWPRRPDLVERGELKADSRKLVNFGSRRGRHSGCHCETRGCRRLAASVCDLRGTVARQSGDRERREQRLEEERRARAFGYGAQSSRFWLWRTTGREEAEEGAIKARAPELGWGVTGQWQQGRGEHGYVTRADDTERVVGHVVEQVELQRPPRYGWMNGTHDEGSVARGGCTAASVVRNHGTFCGSFRDPLGFSSPGPWRTHYCTSSKARPLGKQAHLVG